MTCYTKNKIVIWVSVFFRFISCEKTNSSVVDIIITHYIQFFVIFFFLRRQGNENMQQDVIRSCYMQIWESMCKYQDVLLFIISKLIIYPQNSILAFWKYKRGLKRNSFPSNYFTLYLMDYEHDILSRIRLIKTRAMTNDTKSWNIDRERKWNGKRRLIVKHYCNKESIICFKDEVSDFTINNNMFWHVTAFSSAFSWRHQRLLIICP